jgi:hypothetical protein
VRKGAVRVAAVKLFEPVQMLAAGIRATVASTAIRAVPPASATLIPKPAAKARLLRNRRASATESQFPALMVAIAIGIALAANDGDGTWLTAHAPEQVTSSPADEACSTRMLPESVA